jgi:hypothetical protein
LKNVKDPIKPDQRQNDRIPSVRRPNSVCQQESMIAIRSECRNYQMHPVPGRVIAMTIIATGTLFS